jgi:hypothetical protein
MTITDEERASLNERMRVSSLSHTDLMRYLRNMRLQASDWTQLPDVPEATSIKWAPYRQALRDITSQEEFPSNIVWPSVPE